MREGVARALCKAAAVPDYPCLTCEDGRCTLWDKFLDEADAAIAEVRRHARLFSRKVK